MSLMEFGWRRLNFFDKIIVTDPKDPNEKFVGLKDVQVSCWGSDSSRLFVGEISGAIFVLDKAIEPYVWRSYQAKLIHLTVTNYLISIGEDDYDKCDTTLKVWEKVWEEDARSPPELRSIRLCGLLGPTGAGTPATTVAAHSNGKVTAVGYADGSVMAYCGDVVKDRAAASRWHRLCDQNALGGVVGIAIASLKGDAQYVMFVMTARTLSSYVIDAKGTIITKTPKYDAAGVSRDCWTFSEKTNQLIIANKDMVYFYDADACVESEAGKGRCHALGRTHEKLQLAANTDFLALVTKQPALIGTGSSADEYMSVVTVYDVRGQYIAFSCSLPKRCQIFLLADTFMVLDHAGVLSSLTLKHLNARLDILYKKNFYDVAIGIAKRSEDSEQVLPTIHSKYGDYLYGKGDFENAITQYKETIGVVEPSYVIKKFLDGSKMRQMVAYLEALHAKGVQNTYHTTILVNCYARLGMRDSILQLIEHPPKNGTTDIDAVIETLRSAHLPTEATLLAVKNNRFDSVLSIMVEDSHRYDQAVKYIGKLPEKEACKYLEKYGRILLVHEPEQLMELLQRMLDENRQLDSAQLLQIFVADAQKGLRFLESLAAKNDSNARLLDTIVELHLRQYKKGEPFDVENNVMKYVKGSNDERILCLAELFECEPVIENLLKKKTSRLPLLHFYMRKNRVQDVIDLCCLLDEQPSPDQSVWLDTLIYLSKIDFDVDEQSIQALLECIKKRNSVHPLVVLEILSRSTRLKVSAVKEFIVEWLKLKKEQIEADEKAIEENEQHIREVEKQIENLNFQVQTHQVSKCCACDTQLQLPAIHFLCKHAFHRHCFESYADRQDTCPACTSINQADAENNRDFSSRQAHNKFVEELCQSTDSMALIADYMKNGLFDVKKVEPVSSPFSARPRPTLTTTRTAAAAARRAASPKNPFDELERTPSRTTVVSSTNPFDEPARTATPTNPFSTNPFDDDM